MVPFKPIPVLWMKIYYFPLRFSKKVKCGFILHRQWRKLREIASFQDQKQQNCPDVKPTKGLRVLL